MPKPCWAVLATSWAAPERARPDRAQGGPNPSLLLAGSIFLDSLHLDGTVPNPSLPLASPSLLLVTPSLLLDRPPHNFICQSILVQTRQRQARPDTA